MNNKIQLFSINNPELVVITEPFIHFNDVYSDMDGYGFLYYKGNLSVSSLNLDNGWNIANKEELKKIFDTNEIDILDTGITTIGGLIVDGDLLVDGSVINAESDDGCCLLVTGSLKAHNLLAGGSYIHIKGDARIEECVFGYYNHGILLIDSLLVAPVVLNSDHHFEAKKIDATCDLELGYDDVLPKKLRTLVKNEIKTREDLFDELSSGNYILAGSKFDRPKDEKYYVVLVENALKRGSSDCKILKKVPESFRSQKICKTALDINPLNVKFVPKDQINADLCEALVKRTDNKDSKSGGYSYLLSYIPQRFRTPELCMAHLLNNKGIPISQFVPKKYLTHKFCLEAASYGGIMLEDLPDAMQEEDEVLEAVLRNDGYQLRKIAPEKMTTNILIAAIIGGEYETVSLYLEDSCRKQQDDVDKLLTEALKWDISVLNKVPGYAITKELYDYIKNMYGTTTGWEDIEKRHTTDFWKYKMEGKIAPDQMQRYQNYLNSIERDITHEERYSDAFEHVWLCFWTEEFVINTLKYTEADIKHIPESFYTKKIVMAAYEYDSYGSYTDYLPDSVRLL